jgi:hypothetical protein
MIRRLSKGLDGVFRKPILGLPHTSRVAVRQTTQRDSI